MSKNNQLLTNIFDLNLLIWKGKWKVLTFIVAITFVSFLYKTYISPFKFISKTIIRPLPATELNNYQVYNDIRHKFFKIDSDLLFNGFLSIMRDKNYLEKAIIKSKLLVRNNFETEIDYKKSLDEIVKSIVIHYNPNKKTTEIRFSHLDEEKSLKTLNFIISDVTNSLREKLIKDFKQHKIELDDNLNYNINQIKLERSRAEQKFIQKFGIMINYLETNQSIAKNLGIKRGIHTPNINFSKEKLNYFLGALDQQYYLRGYEIINEELKIAKKQLSQIKKGKNIDFYLSEELEKIDNEILIRKNFLNNYNEIERIFNNTHVNNPKQFVAILALTNNINPTYPYKVIFWFSIITFGAFLGILFVICQDIIFRRNQ